MSFAAKVKAELAKIVHRSEHCIRATAEARKYFTLVKREYKIDEDVLAQRCCRRSFLREVFLISGTISDPNKSYHFEISCPSEAKAEYVRDLINTFDGMEAKIVRRKNAFIVYLKGSDMIVDMLGIMEASMAFMELENVRILKEMRNSVNRRVNCETANIQKTVTASSRQLEDIQYIRDTVGFQNLPPALAKVAQLRLAHPDATLSELAGLSEPPIGKSGVNHRLRKLCEYAGSLRDGKEGEK